MTALGNHSKGEASLASYLKFTQNLPHWKASIWKENAQGKVPCVSLQRSRALIIGQGSSILQPKNRSSGAGTMAPYGTCPTHSSARTSPEPLSTGPSSWGAKPRIDEVAKKNGDTHRRFNAFSFHCSVFTEVPQ